MTRNDTLAVQLERLPLTLLHWRIIGATSLVYLFVVPNLLVLGFVLAHLMKVWALSPLEIGMISGTGLAGMFLGSILGGSLGDKYGRKATVLGTLGTACALSTLSALALNAVSLASLRFLAAVALASALTTPITLIAEITPTRYRGRTLIFIEVMWSLGSVLAALLGFLVIPALGWRWAFVLGGLPLLVLPLMHWAIVESPRFLASKGRLQEAQTIAERLVKAARVPRSAAGGPLAPGQKAGSAGMTLVRLWSGPYRRRSLVLWVIWLVLNFTYFGLFIWLPSLLIEQGFAKVSAFRWMIYLSLMLAPGAVLGGLLADRLGRKVTIALAMLLNGITVYLFAQMLDTGGLLLWGGLLALTHQAIWVASITYTSELYPVEIRARGMAYASAFGRIGAFSGPYLVGAVLLGAGFQWVFVMFATVLLLGGLTVFSLGEETRGEVLS